MIKNSFSRLGVVRVVVVAICFPFFSAATPASATTWIVDQTGGGDFLGIQEAIDNVVVQAGDTIFVRAGTYSGGISITKNLTLQCAGPDVVTLRNDLGNTVTVDGAFNFGISGCTITGASYGIFTASGANVTITNNVIVGNRDGVNAGWNTGSVAVRNNVLAYNREDGYDHYSYGNRSTTIRVLTNNIAVNNAACGIREEGNNPTPELGYNNVRDNGTDYCGTVQGDHPLYDPEIPGTVVPGFVDANRGDFRLAANSANRDRGTPTAADLDPDGTRNDIGAFGGSGAAGFFPSDNLGPNVRQFTISPSSAPQGASVSLQATGEVNTR